MIISERIYELMKEKGITQRYLAEKTGIAQSTISDWKRKKTNPAADKILPICEVLDVTPYELLAGAAYESKFHADFLLIDRKSEDFFVLEQYNSLARADKNRVIGYMQALKEKK